MLNQFYNYLSKKTIVYLEEVYVKNGDKFNIQFEKEEQVKGLYEELKRACKAQEFKYTASVDEYKTFSFNVDDIKVIVAATVNNVKPDFLTLLRNKTGSNEDYRFKNTAILFIHNTTLDSIVGGTVSFQKEGMPFHINSIVKDITSGIEDSNLSRADKLIVQFDLDKRTSQVHEDNTSLFQYEDILTVLNSDGIKEEEYRNFGLFYDQKLNDEIISGKDALSRCKW